MAVVQNFNQDNKDNEQQTGPSNQDQFSNKPVSVSGAEAPSESSGPAQGPGGANKPTSSGRFTNLQSYLQAQAPNVNLAGDIAKNLQGRAGEVEKSFNTAQDQFKTNAEQNRQQYNPNLVNQAVADPTKFSQDANNVSSFQKLRDATFSGQPLQQFQTANQGVQNQADQLNSLTNLAGSEEGRYTLLNKLYGGKGSYTRGQQSLDNLLLQTNPTQLNALQDVNKIVPSLQQKFAPGQQQVEAQAKQYADEAAKTQEQTRKALTDAYANQRKSIDAKIAQDEAERQNVLSQLNGAGGASATQISAQLARKLGMNVPENMINYGNGAVAGDPSQSGTVRMSTGTDLLSRYLATQGPNATNDSSPEMKARIQALSSLAGNTNPELAAFAEQINQQGINPFNAYAFNNAGINFDAPAANAPSAGGPPNPIFSGTPSVPSPDVTHVDNFGGIPLTPIVSGGGLGPSIAPAPAAPAAPDARTIAPPQRSLQDTMKDYNSYISSSSYLKGGLMPAGLRPSTPPTPPPANASEAEKSKWISDFTVWKQKQQPSYTPPAAAQTQPGGLLGKRYTI